MVEPRAIDPRGEGEIARLVALGRGIAGGEGAVTEAQVGGPRHERGLRDADVTGQAVGVRAKDAAGDHAEVGMLRFRRGGGVGDGWGFAGQNFDAAIVVR